LAIRQASSIYERCHLWDIERFFSRIKQCRRIATRYDRLARNFHAAVCIAAVICYWL
jgi:transposase